MFDGEYRSLECLYAADIVHVPKPIKVQYYTKMMCNKTEKYKAHVC